jgi:hypothetical protein
MIAKLPAILLLLFIPLLNPFSQSITDTEAPHINKVMVQMSKNQIKYNYSEKGNERSIIFQKTSKETTVKITANKQIVGELKSNGKNVVYRANRQKTFKPYAAVFSEIDKTVLAILLSNPTFNGREYIGKALDSRNILSLEKAIADFLRPATRRGGHDSTQVTRASCGCGSKTIVVTCPNGCGVDCSEEDREICEYDDAGNPTNCQTMLFCIGACRC